MGIFPLQIPVLRNIISICSAAANGRILNPDHNGRIYVLGRRGDRYCGVRLVSVLSELKVGETGVVETLELPESVQNHLMHMGFVPNARVTALRRAPAGDPTVYAVDGLEIALRHETATAIRVRQAEDGAPGLHATEAATAEPEANVPEVESIPASIELAGIARGVAQ